MPVFIKVDDPKTAHELLQSLKSQISEAKGTLARIDKVSKEESSKINECEKKFSSISDRIDSTKGSLSEPERI